MTQKAHVFLRGADKTDIDIGEKEVSPSPELRRTLRFMHQGKIVTGVVERIVPTDWSGRFGATPTIYVVLSRLRASGGPCVPMRRISASCASRLVRGGTARSADLHTVPPHIVNVFGPGASVTGGRRLPRGGESLGLLDLRRGHICGQPTGRLNSAAGFRARSPASPRFACTAR